MNRVFYYPDSGRYVLFTSPALGHMYRWCQRAPWHKEAGGELFAANPDDDGLIIAAAKGPHKGDYRARRAFNPDVAAGYDERQRQYAQGLHPVGLWHTHPERFPEPSNMDYDASEAYFKALDGESSGYLMAVLGNHGNIPVMAVWAVHGVMRLDWVRLHEDNQPLALIGSRSSNRECR